MEDINRANNIMNVEYTKVIMLKKAVNNIFFYKLHIFEIL